MKRKPKIDDKNFFGKNLKKIRKLWGFETQESFVDFLRKNFNQEVTRGMIASYETGNTMPGVPLVLLLQQTTGINASLLFDRFLVEEQIPTEPIYPTMDLPEPPEDQAEFKITAETELYYLPKLISKVNELAERLERIEKQKSTKK